MKITIADIQQANEIFGLNTLLETAAQERNCELALNMTYKEQAEIFHDEARDIDDDDDFNKYDLAELLEAAEIRWYELEEENG